jgi:hypothetical protein
MIQQLMDISEQYLWANPEKRQTTGAVLIHNAAFEKFHAK